MRNGMQKMASRAYQKGLTLIELTVGLVVVGAIVLMVKGGPMLVGWYQGQGEANQVVSALNCQSSLSSTPLFGSTTLSIMVNNNCFSDATTTGYGTGTATAQNAFGSAYTIAAVTYGGVANSALQVASPSVPSRACPQMVKKLDTSGVQQIAIGSTTVKDVAAGTTLSDSTLATQCSAATTATIYAARTKSGS